MSERPDRASGLLVHRSKRDLDVELTKTMGMVRGVIRVVGLDARRLMVVFEAEQRTGEDEYGSAIKDAIESMVESDVKVEWIEENFTTSYGLESSVRRETFEALCDLAKRVHGPNGSLVGTGDEAVELRVRRKFASMIQETAGEILSPKKDR